MRAIPLRRNNLDLNLPLSAARLLHPINFPAVRRAAIIALLACTLLPLAACRHSSFPVYPLDYREFAYITNGGSNTVTVLDLVNLRQERVLAVGANPTGLAANPARNEVYAVNTGSNSVSVINAETNRVAATIPVQRRPYFIDVDHRGARAYVANSGSNDVSVIDLASRRTIASAAAGEGPGEARISPDDRSLVVSNRISNSVSVSTFLRPNLSPT